jgi:hypothetical protein
MMTTPTTTRKPTRSEVVLILNTLATLIVLLLVAFGGVAEDPPADIGGPEARGQTHFGDVTIGGDLVASGAITLTTGAIDAAEIANVTRTVSVPLHSFIECTTDAGANLDFNSGADAFPDLINAATDGLGFALVFDDTGGTEDTTRVCSQFTLPSDYTSGGAFSVRASKDADAGATELINCAVSLNGAALLATGTITTTATANTAYTCTPTFTAAAALDSVGFTLYITSGTTADDAVSITSVGFNYVSTQ